MTDHQPVNIVMIEDDEGHARLIEKNIRRAGIYNDIRHFADGTSALDYLFKATDGPGAERPGAGAARSQSAGHERHRHPGPDQGRASPLKRTPVVVLTTTDDKVEIQRCYDLGCNVYITKPVNYESFADAIRQLGLFLSVMQVPELGEVD